MRTAPSRPASPVDLPPQAGEVKKLSKRLGVTIDHRLQLGGGVVVEVAGIAYGIEDIDVLAAQQRQQAILELTHLGNWKRIEIAVGAGPDHHDLLFHLQRRGLRLLQELSQAAPCTVLSVRSVLRIR